MNEQYTITKILNQIKENNIDMVRFLYVDADGMIRGYSSTSESFEEDFISGHLYAKGMATAFSVLETLAPQSKFGPIGEWSGVPDPSTFRVLPYVPSTASFIVDFKQRESHEESGLCGRSALKKLLNSLGYEVKACFENEFYLLKRDETGKFEPFEASKCFSTRGMNTSHKLITEIIKALQKQGITVEKHYPEYGPGQHEIVMKYVDGLKAADEQILFRETLRGVTQNHNLIASFMPKPSPELPGSGAHIHVSLWKDGKNVFYDKNKPEGLSQTASYFMGGVLKHLSAICAFTAPIVTSYKRLIPHNWASAYACTGINNREAALRISTGQHSRYEKTTNIEFKPVDGTCNPYLALSAILAAGAEGIEKQIIPSEPLECDPGNLTENERKNLGIYRLPRNLGEAISALEEDEFFKEVFGEMLYKEYIALKSFMWEEYNKQITDWEIKHFLEAF